VITEREADDVVTSECAAIRPQSASANQFSNFLEADFWGVRGRISGKRVIRPLRTSPASKRCLKHPPTQGWLEGAVPVKGSLLRMSSGRLILSLTFKQPLDKLRVSRGVLLLDSL